MTVTRIEGEDCILLAIALTIDAELAQFLPITKYGIFGNKMLNFRTNDPLSEGDLSA